MKNSLKIALLVIVTLSCSGLHEKNQNLIESNPFLTGTWKGEGRFFNTTRNAEYGPILFEIVLSEEGIIKGNVGDARLTKTSIRKAAYGFEIRGILDAKLKKDKELDRKHLIILLVLPEDKRDSVKFSDANFHLKNNYIFDFRMRVGGVGLAKEP